VVAVSRPLTTDADQIAASVEDPAAFAAVFDRHYDALAGYLRRRLEPALADELAAETFLRAFDARGRYDRTRADARPWLFGIAANLLSRHWRDESRRLRAFARAAGPGADDPGTDAADARVDARASHAALAAGLAALAPDDREALLLYAWVELTYEQIGEALAIPTGTVRSRLHRARAVLREALATPTEEIR